MTVAGWRERFGPFVVAAGLIALAVPVFIGFTPDHSATTWLSARLGIAWIATAFFALACLSGGTRILKWLSPGPAWDGSWAMSLALGVLAFGLSIAALGHLHLLSPAIFWLLPISLLAAGGSTIVDDVLAWRRRSRQPFTPTELIWIGLGIVGLFLALLPIVTTDNVDFDARWYHLALAERYAGLGAITPTGEGDHLVASPQLASWLYTWAFLHPSDLLFDRVVLANHLEALCFLATLAGVPALTRALVPSLPARSTRLAWVAVFLFPSLYIYDTGLMAGADHVAALFVPVSLVAWLQARDRNDARSWLLPGLLLGGLVLTKYTSIILVGPLAAVVAIDAAWKLRREGLKALRGPLILAGTALVVTSGFWLRNWVWYGNPVYPQASGLFASRPWSVDSATWQHRYSLELFVPSDGTALYRLKQTIASLWDYHLALYTWDDFTARTPIFGSLYAFSLVPLLFLRGTKRLWVLAIIVHLGIALWFNLAHQIRYLLILVPAMAAAVTAVFQMTWSWGKPIARFAVLGVLALQVVAAGDIPFLPTHRMNGRAAPLHAAMSFIGRGPAERTMERYKPYKEWVEVGAALPPKAKVLLHQGFVHLGIGRETLTDTPGIQYGLNYGRLGSIGAIHARLKELNVTHLGWTEFLEQPDSVAGELLFRSVAQTATAERQAVRGWNLAELADTAPPEPTGGVFYWGCGGAFTSGLYELADLAAPPSPSDTIPSWHLPRVATQPLPALLDNASYAVLEEACPGGPALPGFVPIGRSTVDGIVRGFYLRVTGAPVRPFPQPAM